MKLRFNSFANLLAILLLVIFSSTSYSKDLKIVKEPARNLIKRQLPDKTLNKVISGNSQIARVIVKFKEGSEVSLENDLFISAKGGNLSSVNDLLAPYRGGLVNRLVAKSDKRLKSMKQQYELATGYEMADFSLYYKLNITNPNEAELIVNRLNELDAIEIAYAEPLAFPAVDIDPPTSDYTGFQFYLNAAPNGVDADYANTQPGGDGAGVKIIDVENNWNETHEDLEAAVGGTLNGGHSQSGHHGTAVIGVMIGGDNGYGVTGICPGAEIGMASAAINGTTEAILLAVDDLEPGDLILIELHSPGPRYNFEVRSDQLGYIAMEYWQANFDAMFYAWAKGLIVCEAAGNGAEDFDDVIYENRFDTTFRNSHAIIIGAGAPISGASGTPRSRLGFSNYGERVNLQGYGREVFTTGYGGYWDGDGDLNQYYTSTFSGTSSASPIVTGSVASLQGYYKNAYGVPVGADLARDYLIATGTVQQGDTTEHIGPLPNLNAAFAIVAPPPSLYANPILVDTIVTEGDYAETDIWVHNRSASQTMEYNFELDPYLYNPDSSDWLGLDGFGGPNMFLSPLDSAMFTVSLDATGMPGSFDITKGMIKINWGMVGSLDSLTYLPVFMEVPCSPDTTYNPVADSDPEGTPYNWIDITSIGTVIPQGYFYNAQASDPLDDGSAGPFLMPFDFEFFGETYDRYYVGVNGGISFTDSDVNGGGYYSAFNIPGEIPMSTFISVFWNDLLMGTAFGAHGDIYTYNSPTNDTTIIEWWQLGSWEEINDTLNTFELILTADGNITMQIQNVGTTGNENTTLVGLSAGGCANTPYFNHGSPVENTVANGSRIDFKLSIAPILSGDANSDGAINILDITYIIAYLYDGGPAPTPLESGDVNCNGQVNILDITFMISYLYGGGPDPCFY